MTNNTQKEMSFLDHLEELRWVLVRCTIAILVLAGGAFFIKDFVYNQIIFGPKDPNFITYRFFCKITQYFAVEGAAFGIDLVHGVFKDQDLFRWHYGDESGEELLVGARLQLEAELICNSRLGGPIEEASRLIDLISQSYRAGSEGNEETKFVIDIVYALGPDGPFGERYKDSYADVARALTALREKNGVISARLMLQEATLRRHYIRTHDLEAADKERILDEASRSVDHALTLIGQAGAQRLHASRKTQENLWVERAATYGYLATDAAQRNASAEEVWSSYRAAREAGQMASGRVDTYFPLGDRLITSQPDAD